MQKINKNEIGKLTKGEWQGILSMLHSAKNLPFFAPVVANIYQDNSYIYQYLHEKYTKYSQISAIRKDKISHQLRWLECGRVNDIDNCKL